MQHVYTIFGKYSGEMGWLGFDPGPLSGSASKPCHNGVSENGNNICSPYLKFLILKLSHLLRTKAMEVDLYRSKQEENINVIKKCRIRIPLFSTYGMIHL